MRAQCFYLGLVAIATAVSANIAQPSTQPILFAATSTKETTNGINTFKLDVANGRLTPFGITPLSFKKKGLNPTFVQGSKKKFSNGKRVIYALNRGVTNGYVSAMTLQSNGTLDVINSQTMLGGKPAYAALSFNEDFISVANYAGSISLFPLELDGSVGAETFYQEYPIGSMVVKDTQATGHVHCTLWLPDSNHLIATNLGSDEILQYELDPTKKTLKSLATVKRPPGSGPRHMAMGSKGDFVYVTDELSSTVGVYKVDKKAALLLSTAIQNITTLPVGFTDTNTAADIHISSNGNFLYVSNRGHNSIVTYKITADGTLKALDWESSRGVTPRAFTIYQNWLIVANADSNDMYVFSVNSDTGALTYTGNSYKIKEAVSLYVGEF
ncbi:putative cytochrome cd1-nitrite reductase-like, hem d1 domain superfamily [Plasmopara halstedii]